MSLFVAKSQIVDKIINYVASDAVTKSVGIVSDMVVEKYLLQGDQLQ